MALMTGFFWVAFKLTLLPAFYFLAIVSLVALVPLAAVWLLTAVPSGILEIIKWIRRGK